MCLRERLVGRGDQRLGVVEPPLRGERPPERELSRPDLLEVVDACVEQIEGLPGLCLAQLRVAALESNLGKRRADIAGVDREVEVDEHLERLLEQFDRPLRIAEQVLESGAVVHQTRHGGAVTQVLEQRARPLGVGAGEEPAPLPLGDERRLEERIRDPAGVRARLGQLERALDIIRGGNPVAVSPVAARTPMEDVRAQAIPGQFGAFRQNERLVEEDDRLGDVRFRVANDADPETRSPPDRRR